MAELTTSYQRIATSTYTVVGSNELRLYGKYNSQDIANNKTNVTFQLRTIATTGSYYSTQNYSTLTCVSNRGTQYYDIGTVDTSSEKTIGTWTFDLSHNNDGTYSGSATASANVYGNIVPSVTGSFTLKSIPRASKFTSGTSVTIADNGTIDIYPTFSKAVNSYYQTLSIKTTDQSATLFTFNNVSSGTHYYPDASQRQQMYNYIGTSDRYVFSLVLNTYTSNGGTLVGTDLVKKVPILPNYTISIAGTMQDTVTAYNTYKPSGHTNDTFIRYLSKPKFTLTATSSTGSYYGRSVSYKLGSTAISNPYTENNYTGQSFSFTATDGRKTSGAYTPSPTIIQYFEPTLNVSVLRTTPTGSTIDISISGTYYSGTGLTNLVTPSVALVYTESGGSQVSTTIPLTTTTSGNTVSFTGTKQLTGMNYQKSVQWAITLTDVINRTNTKSGTLAQGLPVWNGYRKNDTNYFNVNGNANITGETIVNKISSKNMFNYIYISNGKRIASDGTPYNESGYFLSDYISIEPSTTYTISRVNQPSSSMNCYALYDSSKNFISRSSFYTTTNVTFTSSSNAKYIRITDTNNNLSSLQIEKGGTASAYSNYQDFDNFKYERMTQTDFITLNSGFSFGECNIFKYKNHYTGTMTILKNAKFTGQQETIATINTTLGTVPVNINTYGVSGSTNDDRWSIPTNFAYIFITNTNLIYLKGKNTDSYVKFNIDVILN